MIRPWLRLLRDLAAANLGAVRPFRVILMLTARCPHRCAVCGIWKAPPRRDPTIEEIACFFRENRCSWVNLTGGELLLREDLPAVMARIASSPAPPAVLTFPTTGHRPEHAVRAVRAALDAGLPRLYVTVSFDGPPDAHDALRGMDGAFRRAEETYHRLRGEERRRPGRFRVVPGLTLSAPLLERIADPVAALAAALNLSDPAQIHLNLAHRSGHFYRNEDHPSVTPPLEKAWPLLYRYRRGRRRHPGIAGFVEAIYRAGGVPYLEGKGPPLPCRAARASVFVDAEWRAWPCTVFPHTLGDLRAAGFRLSALADRGAFAEAVRAIEGGGCPGCWTPCEAFTSILCSFLEPGLYRLSARRVPLPPVRETWRGWKGLPSAGEGGP